MRSTLVLSVAALLAAAAPAEAQFTATATPDRAGKAATVSFNLGALEAPVNGRIPRSMTISAAGGFAINPKAIPKRCTQEEATLQPPDCPADSKIGTGSIAVIVTIPGKAPRPATFPITIYRAPANGVYALMFIEGYKAVPATISTSGGLSLAFNPLPTVSTFGGLFTVTVQSISVSLGGSIVVATRKRVRGTGHGKHKRKAHFVTKRTRYNILSNPSHCGGNWPATFTLGFPDGSSTTLNAAIACTSK